MCGIAGFVDPSLPKTEAHARLGRMLDLLAHRGPDGQGAHVAPGGAAFGMRRLSIIDLAGGTQPIWNEDRTIAVVFNGEIYNYVELRAELQARGHVFRTRSDTEVLVHLYEDDGEALVQQLRGMFAFALYDGPRAQLLLARDHFGQKPLYYASVRGRVAFASELKSLFALPWVGRDRDEAACLDYLGWLSLPPPATHFPAIKKLPAGCSVTIRLATAEPSAPRSHWRWDLESAPDLHALPKAVEELDFVLRDSVRVHLRSDVPMGVLLSSGLDSRAVASYAQELQGGALQSFTVGFGGPHSETVGAAVTARELGSRHHTLELGPDDLLDNVERVAWHLDEPVGDPAAFAVLKVCELARGHVKVLLSGEGSDELFAGYDGRYLGMQETLRRSSRLRPFASLLPEPNFAAPPSRWQRLLARAHHSRGGEEVSLRLEGLPGDSRHPRVLNAGQQASLYRRSEEVAAELCIPQRDTLSELLALDLRWQLAESLLQKADKMSMAASIELRTPLLDRRVAELAARIPSALKLPTGGPGKLVLRHCLAARLQEPLNRPKLGFPLPLAEWFRGSLREPVEAALFASDAALPACIERPRLRSAWEDFLAGHWDGARAFYSIWLYETWARRMRAPLPS